MSPKRKVVYKWPGASAESSGESTGRKSPSLTFFQVTWSAPGAGVGAQVGPSWANTLLWRLQRGDCERSLRSNSVEKQWLFGKRLPMCLWAWFFLPELLFTLENFDAFEKTTFSNSSLIISKLQPPAIIFLNSLLSALNPKKLTTKFSRSRFINSSCN